jgi:hypothetical protein
MPSALVANAKRLVVWMVALGVTALTVALATGAVP